MFGPEDSRSRVLEELVFTGTEEAWQAAKKELDGLLVSDCYGLVSGMRCARNAYNSRRIDWLSDMRVRVRVCESDHRALAFFNLFECLKPLQAL